MSTNQAGIRRTWRRTEKYDGESPLLVLVTEELASHLPPTFIRVKLHAISINYRDANITNGRNPWPVLPNGIPCSDAAGEIIAVGDTVKNFVVGDRVSPIFDQASITGREQDRIWLAADVDGVLADYLELDERLVSKIPDHLSWTEASTLPCAGLTAWSALKGMTVGNTVLIQGTGGVSMMALKLARAAGCRVILTSSSDQKLHRIREQFPHPPIGVVNYSSQRNWHEEVIKLNGGVGVDITIENGGTGSLIQSLQATKRGGTVSQVGYLGEQNPNDLNELLPILIDRKTNLRGINVGSKHDLEDLYLAISANKMLFNDIIDARYTFEKAPDAIQHVWQGKQVGKLVIEVKHES